MQLPQKSTKLRKLIDAMPKDRKVSKAQAASLMASVGYDINLVDRTLSYLQSAGYFYRAGSHYSLTEGVMKNYQPKEEPAPVIEIIRPRESGIDEYGKKMRRAARLDDGHEVMTFLPMLSS